MDVPKGTWSEPPAVAGPAERDQTGLVSLAAFLERGGSATAPVELGAAGADMGEEGEARVDVVERVKVARYL